MSCVSDVKLLAMPRVIGRQSCILKVLYPWNGVVVLLWNGVMVKWCYGKMEKWCNGAMIIQNMGEIYGLTRLKVIYRTREQKVIIIHVILFEDLANICMLHWFCNYLFQWGVALQSCFYSCFCYYQFFFTLICIPFYSLSLCFDKYFSEFLLPQFSCSHDSEL